MRRDEMRTNAKRGHQTRNMGQNEKRRRTEMRLYDKRLEETRQEEINMRSENARMEDERRHFTSDYTLFNLLCDK